MSAMAVRSSLHRLLDGLRHEPGLLVSLVLIPFFVAAATIQMVRFNTLAQRVTDLSEQMMDLKIERRLTVDAATTTLNQRIENLEKQVFVDVRDAIEKKHRPISPAENWQRRRDDELRRRLAALEQWRLRHGEP